MPKRIQLPDGRWIYVPDMDSYLGQIIPDPRSLEQQYYFGSGEEEEEEDEGTLAGSAWEGFKSIPSGVADVFLSGAQAAIGVVTPFADLPVEKRLRRQASKRARERDPAYRDAFLPAVGTGLGQVAGLSALSRLPGGWYAAMGAGIGMGISEQTRRIADYEQRTGTNVPWYKESAAHMMGALIGLSEVVPIKFGLFPASVSRMMGRMHSGLDPSSFRHMSKLEKTLGLKGALGSGLMEATQEASAQWLQALSARGLYDPNAMQDIARSMAEDFKVGGVVGGIARLVQHQILGRKFRGDTALHAVSGTLREGEYRQDNAVKSVGRNIAGISDELLPIFRELGVDEDIAGQITEHFGGEYAAIPFGMDEALKSGSISRSQVELLVRDFERRNEYAKGELDGLIKYYSDAKNEAEVIKYTRAKAALEQMATERLKGLRITVDELRGGLGEMGGLTGSIQYQEAKQAAIEDDADQSLLGVLESRLSGKSWWGAERHPSDPVIDPSMYRGPMRSLMGGLYGAGGFIKMAEDLGVHRGPLSEKISVGVDGNIKISDLGLASSDRSNFGLVELGEILLSRRGLHDEASTPQRPVDRSDVMDSLIFADSIPQEGGRRKAEIRRTLDELDKSLEVAEESNDNLYKSPNYAFTRESSEIYGGRKYVDDADWMRHRDDIQQAASMQGQRNDAEISRINREKSIIYLHSLGQRLQEAKNHFLRSPEDKKKAAERVLGTPVGGQQQQHIERFDQWLDETINAVTQSESNGQNMSMKAETKRLKFVKDMAALDVDASDAERDALETKFLSENVREFIVFPRDISAPQFIKIADLFIDDPKDTKKVGIHGAFAMRALGNISKWQVRDALYDVGVAGVPIPNETRSVVENFVYKLVKNVGLDPSTFSPDTLTEDQIAKIYEKDGLPEYISADDIVELLGSKNIYLRDGTRIGNSLAKLTGAGVESRPFKKLLLDMTGASSWGEATYAQRLLMYSRLLQLPAHYRSRGNPEDQLYLEGLGKENYRPLFLPDFYHNPSIDSHVAYLIDRVGAVRTMEAQLKYPSLSIRTLRADTRTALGNEFNSQSFDEALARLIETGVFNPTDSADPDVILSPDTWEAQHGSESWEGVASGIVMLSGGSLGSDVWWDKIGQKFGLSPNNIKHFHSAQHTRKRLPLMNTVLSEKELAEADPHVRTAAMGLGKTWKGRHSPNDDYLRRNWFQVRDADQVFAIGKWNEDPNLPRGKVDGGTGWAVQMAMDEGKQIFFFNQIRSDRHGTPGWYTVDYDEDPNLPRWNTGKWVRTSVPAIKGKFAGVGTRGINAAGKKAIEDVYNKTKNDHGARVLLGDQQIGLGVGGFKRNTLVEILNTYGILGEGGKNPEFLWGTTPDDQRLETDSDEEWLAKKWEPVIKEIFPDFAWDIDVEFIKPEDEMEIFGPDGLAHLRHHKVAADGTKMPGEVVQISFGRFQKYFQGILDNKAIRYPHPHIADIDPRDFYDENEVMLLVIGHEFSHARLPIQQFGYQESDYAEMGRIYGEYETEINRMALADVDNYMMGQLNKLYKNQRIEEIKKEKGRVATAVSESRVRLNAKYKPLDQGWVATLGITQPGDTRAEEFWVTESDPKLARKNLANEDAAWASQVDDMLAYWNEKHPDKPLSKEEYIEQHASLITSNIAPLQELSDLGILDTVIGATAMPGGRAPTENVLQLGTAGGRSLVQALMKTGAIPSSLQDDIHALRRRFVDTIKTRFEVFTRTIEKNNKTLRIPDNIGVMYVDDANGLFQFLGDVAVRGKEMSAELPAMYDRPGNRIIINLAAVDPNNMVSAQEVVSSAALHEGLHALIIRDHLTEEELNILYNFVRNEDNIVPEEIDRIAYDANLTWFERAVVESVDVEARAQAEGRVDYEGLAEADIEKEAVISLLENIVQHPDIYVKGKKIRKIRKDIRGFLEGFVDAAKDADIVDVMKIVGRIERGEVGHRGAGFLGKEKYTVGAIVRSNDLLRYANSKDIEQLRTAMVLRDAAPSDQMRISEQSKVDDIVDKIIANRGIIQESAGPSVDEVTALQDARKLIQSIRNTPTGNVPLPGLDHSKKNPEAYRLALNTFMEMRGKDPKYAYKMPAQYQMFSRPKSSPESLENVREAIKDGIISPVDKDTTRKSLDNDGVLDGNPGNRTGETFTATVDNIGKTARNLRYLYLDRRQWIVEQTDKLLAAQNRAQLDAETSALVMWRNSDNALNWLPGLMLRGPLSYLGTSVGSGRFENAPVYDDELQETYGGDGRIQGLNEIFAPIIEPQDQENAALYGFAKRILWTKNRLDSLRSATGGIAIKDLDPTIRLKLEKFEESYRAINPLIEEQVGDRVIWRDKWTADRLDKIIRPIETNESNQFIIEFWDRYNAYDNHMIKMSYNTGMITREVRDEWLSMPFAPFYRDVETDEDFPIGSRAEIAKRGRNLVERALTGSTEPIKTSLADGIITNTAALVRDAMMNVSVSRTVRDAVALGDAKRIDISSMAGSLNNRVVRVMENGIPVFYELRDAQLAMSVMMLGFNPKKQLQELFGEHKLGQLIQKSLTGASSLLRESVTRTPPFAIKNVFRDSWNAMSLTGGGPMLVIDAFRNALDTDILRRADEAGLSIGIDFVAEPGEYGKKMQKELDKANPDWKNPFTPFAVAWNFAGGIAKQSEVATRLAVYDRILAMTGDKSLAQYYAIEIMNYGRRGASPTLSTYMATVPFMNGRLQGLDVTYRGLRSKKGSSDIPGAYGFGLTVDEYEGLPSWQKNRANLLGRGLLLTAATAVLYMLMRDDDEWQDLRDEVKADNWVLPMSDHAWLKIPIPFEIGVLFKVIPEQILEAIMEKDVGVVDVGEETIRQLKTSLSIGAPQLLAPIANAMRNYDTFRKDAIVDHWMEETLSPNEQRNMYTSNVARGVADFANSIPLVRGLDFLTSPMKIEYMMRQYVGTAGGYVVTLVDRMARTGILPDLPYDPYMNLAEAESVIGTNKDFDFKSLIGGEGVVNVPILGDLLTDPRTRGGRQQEFFEMIEELDTTIATLNSITERDRKKGFEYREKHLDVLRHQRQLRYIQNQMRKWRERRDFLGKLPRGSMSDDEKREYYQRLLESRQSILTSVNTLMTSIKQG